MEVNELIDDVTVQRIFSEAAILDPKEACILLEQYKFITRSALVSRLSDYCENPVLELDEFTTDEQFIETQKMFGVLIKKSSKNSCIIYYSFFEELSKESLELRLSDFDIGYVALTPYNFESLLDPEKRFEKWDSQILFKRILIEALHLKATDLHFTVEHHNLQPHYVVKYRKNGMLYPLNLFELTGEMNYSITSSLIAKKTSTDSLDLTTPGGVTAVASDPLGTGDIELRVSANKVESGMHCVIRIQTKETFNFSIDQLGFADDVVKELHKMTKRRSGIIFITGAIRTGKNTTAFAMANEMVNEPIKIASYEYPIEVLMPFPQIDYKDDIDTLLNAVRLAKKQDLNVAFINELPNKEVAFAVKDLVDSSIYVITTMHVDRIWHLPYKLRDYYGADYRDVISQINAVFNQKMFSVPCKECQDFKLIDTLDEERRKMMEKYGANKYAVNRGCPNCSRLGIVDGANQPYVEWIEFTQDLKSKLLACSEPFEMEIVLREEVQAKGHTLENYMVNAVSEGRLSVDALNSLL